MKLVLRLLKGTNLLSTKSPKPSLSPDTVTLISASSWTRIATQMSEHPKNLVSTVNSLSMSGYNWPQKSSKLHPYLSSLGLFFDLTTLFAEIEKSMYVWANSRKMKRKPTLPSSLLSESCKKIRGVTFLRLSDAYRWQCSPFNPHHSPTQPYRGLWMGGAGCQDLTWDMQSKWLLRNTLGKSLAWPTMEGI